MRIAVVFKFPLPHLSHIQLCRDFLLTVQMKLMIKTFYLSLVCRWCSTWPAVGCRAVWCWCVKDTLTSAGTLWRGNATSTSCALLSSATVKTRNHFQFTIPFFHKWHNRSNCSLLTTVCESSMCLESAWCHKHLYCSPFQAKAWRRMPTSWWGFWFADQNVLALLFGVRVVMDCCQWWRKPLRSPRIPPGMVLLPHLRAANHCKTSVASLFALTVLDTKTGGRDIVYSQLYCLLYLSLSTFMRNSLLLNQCMSIHVH